jgi:hypothetical protein
MEGLKAWIASRHTFTSTTAADLYAEVERGRA